MLCFEKGSQLILVVVLPRMSLSSETSFVLCVELQCLSLWLVSLLHLQDLYVSHFSHAAIESSWLGISVQFIAVCSAATLNSQ